MLQRENLNTEKGLIEIINFNDTAILDGLKKIDKLKDAEQKGIQLYLKPNLDVIKSTKDTIITYYFDIINAKYSVGYDIAEIKTDFNLLLDVMSELWREKDLYEFTYAGGSEPYYGTDEYWQVLTLIAFGILLNADTSQFQKIRTIRDKVATPDILLDFFLSFKDQRAIHKDQLTANKYDGLVKILLKQDKTSIVSDLKTYLSKTWYKEYKKMGWGETHNNKHNIHTGYWSFESGALVKALGLDDSSLKNQPYYPYDMVHWQE